MAHPSPSRRLVTVLALAAACAVPAIAAADAAASRKSEKRQNRAIRSNAKAVKKLGAGAKTLTGGLAAIDDRLRAIEQAAPAIVDGLAQLKAGLTTASEGLTKLKTAASSTEYGIGQVIVLVPSPDPQEGAFVETPDIPDSVQQAQTTQQFVAQQTGNLAVSYGVRSGESDGTGAALPAALCKVTVTNEGGVTQTTSANPSIGGLPFQPVNDKSKLTSTDPLNAGFPFGLKTTPPDDDKVNTFVSSVPVGAGDTYTVGLACVDTSADANDPSA
jgi:hypothetical protein